MYLHVLGERQAKVSSQPLPIGPTGGAGGGDPCHGCRVPFALTICPPLQSHGSHPARTRANAQQTQPGEAICPRPCALHVRRAKTPERPVSAQIPANGNYNWFSARGPILRRVPSGASGRPLTFPPRLLHSGVSMRYLLAGAVFLAWLLNLIRLSREHAARIYGIRRWM